MLAGDKSKTETWKQCDWQFHHALISACGSKVLLDAHAAAYDKYLRYQMLAVVFRGEIAAVEHQKLMDTALHSHIQDCVTHALTKSEWLRPAATPARAQSAENTKRMKAR